MTQNGLKLILNRSLEIMELVIADPPLTRPITENYIFFKASFPLSTFNLLNSLEMLPLK